MQLGKGLACPCPVRIPSVCWPRVTKRINLTLFIYLCGELHIMKHNLHNHKGHNKRV